VLKFSNEETFICLIPTVIIYMMAYGLMLRPDPEPSLPSSPNAKEETLNDDMTVADDSRLLGTPSETRVARYWRCIKLVAWQAKNFVFILMFFVMLRKTKALNLMLVYFFEYVASVGAADKSQPFGSTHSPDWLVRNAFVLLALSYQLGVFISRSSLRIVRIRRVEILTIIQAANFVLWILQACYKFMPIGAQLPLMVFVGLLGGWLCSLFSLSFVFLSISASNFLIFFFLISEQNIFKGASYVNIFYNLLHDEIYPEEDRGFF
jgi:hypothetical protein